MEGSINSLALLAIISYCRALAYGSQLALGALGVTVIYAVLNFSNFSHGEIMSFGAMITILTTYWFAGNWNFYAPSANRVDSHAGRYWRRGFTAASCSIDWFQLYRRQRANSVTYLIVSIGVMFVIGGITRFIIGPNDRNFNDGERFILKARAFKEILASLRGLPSNHHKQLQ